LECKDVIELVYAVHINFWLRKPKSRLPYLQFGVIIYLIICANVLSIEKEVGKWQEKALWELQRT